MAVGFGEEEVVVRRNKIVGVGFAVRVENRVMRSDVAVGEVVLEGVRMRNG